MNRSGRQFERFGGTVIASEEETMERRAYSRSGYTGYSPQQVYSPPVTSYSGMPGSNEIRGTDIVAEYLLKEKVPYILGYAGHGAIGLLDGIYKHTDKIRHISPRIEQGAGFMADVYFRLTGQPLAVYASTGPGPGKHGPCTEIISASARRTS